MSQRDDIDPMDRIGKPLSLGARQAGYDLLARIAPEWTAGYQYEVAGRVASELEADQPYRAREVAMDCGLDGTGAYRLMATLLAHDPVTA